VIDDRLTNVSTSDEVHAAGISAELHVTEAGGHSGFFGVAPEDEEITREIRRFVDAHWGAN
jgi:hypothetical protein